MLKVKQNTLHPNLKKAMMQKKASIQKILENLLPDEFFEEKRNPEQLFEQFESFLPFISWTLPTSTPGTISIVLLTHKQKEKASSLFSYVTRSFLIPGKELYFVLTRTHEFHFENFEDKKFIFCENVIRLETKQDLRTIQKNLPLISVHLRKILGSYGEILQFVRNVNNEPTIKLDMMMKDLYFLFSKYDHLFTEDLFIYFQQFISFANPNFFEPRTARYLLRIFTSKYLFTKSIKRNLINLPHLRHIKLRLLQTNLQFPIGQRRVLGILTTINQPNEHDIMLPSHLFKAAQSIHSNIRLISGSELMLNNESTKTIYIEIDKEDGTTFSKKEKNDLQKWLPDEVALHIEKTTHAIFAPKNEEETFQKTIALSQALTKPEDPLKLLLEFDKQTANELIFQAIIVRSIRLEDAPLSQLLHDFHKSFPVVFDQVKIMGNLDGEFVKEANILQIKVKKEFFLREDNSIHLMQATQNVREALIDALGKVEDLSPKEDSELKHLLTSLIQAFKPHAKTSQFRLENFFYSFSKEQLKKIKRLAPLKDAAALILEASHNNQNSDPIQKKQTAEHLCLLIQTEYKEFKQELQQRLNLMELNHDSLILAENMVHGMQYLTLIYQEKSSDKQKLIIDATQTALERLHEKMQKKQTLKLGISSSSTFLFDPKSAFDQESGILLRLLYEGLMRYNQSNKLEYAIAQRVEISQDSRTYRFHLKKTKWSNGKPLTAHDFADSWKKMIDPDNQTVYACMFYIIKNARRAYEKQASLDDVGITVEDDYIIKVELEYSSPHFLEYISHFAYFPVSQSASNGDLPTSNGPFKLNQLVEKESLDLVKNDHYYDFAKVRLEHIYIKLVENEDRSAILFDQNEIDWAGKPMFHFTQKNKEYFTQKGLLKKHISHSTQALEMNNEVFPFNNKKIRNALSMCLDRSYITKHVTKENQPVAKSIFPHSLSLNPENLIEDNQIEKAKKLFQEGLDELEMKREDLNPISLLHYYTPDLRKVASYIRDTWEKHLNFSINIVSLEWAEICEKLMHSNYQMALINWYFVTKDPLELLNTFKSKKLKMNSSNFYHPRFTNLLNEALEEKNLETQHKLLAEIERLLIDQMPIIPLFVTLDTYVKKDYIRGEYLLPGGDVDFKEAYIEK